MIATGSAPFVPSIPGLAASGYLTSTTAMELDELTDSLIVLGGGYVGLELAQLFARLGTRVSVVETVDGLAPSEEPEASLLIKQVFAEENIEVHTGVIVTNLTRQGPTVLTTLRHPEGPERSTERAAAAGRRRRRPITDALNLAAIGKKIGNRGEVIVDAELCTHNPRIWVPATSLASRSSCTWLARTAR